MVEKNGHSAKRPAVYIPWKTFMTSVEALKLALPSRLDRSVWPSLSGGVQSQVLSAYRFLGFIDDQGAVQPILKKLVAADEQNFKPVLRDVLSQAYDDLLALAEDNATQQALLEALRRRDVQGSTLDRAATFFLHGAQFTGIPLSPHWVTDGRRTVGPARRARRKTASPPAGKNAPPVPPPAAMSSPAATDGSGKASDTVRLQSGGEVVLTVSVNPIQLTSEDRDWLFRLIDQFRSYSQSRLPNGE